jgi:energy-coupling factor transporter ATP-binding protein EcfA2
VARLRHAPVAGADGAIPLTYRLAEYVAARVIGASGGVVVHASSVLDGGGALVFMGHSGAGKSTIAALAESVGAEVLSDDRTVITLGAGGARAWGTPWHGTHTRGSPRSAPIRGLFLLAQADRDAIVPLTAARTFQELHVRVIQPTVDRGELLRAVAAAEQVAAVVRAGELRFRPTPAAYELAWRYAAG